MTVDKNGNDLEKLYKVVSEKFDIGDYDTFSSNMKTKEDREKFYNVVSEKGFDLGDYNEYENRLGKLNEVSQQGSGNTSQPYIEPSQPSQSTSYGGLGSQPLGETQFDLGVNDINFEVAPQLPAQVLGENGEVLNVEIGQAEVVPTDKKTYLQSLENSLNNNLNQFKGIDERIQITGGTLAKKILGQTNTDALSDFLGFDYNVAMDNAYQELDRLGSKMLETGNLTDGEIASGATDAILSLVYTGLISRATAGVVLFTDMVGGSIADYNQTKADNLGVSVEELYKQNKEDVIAPAIIGGLGFALERIGLKGVQSAMTRQLSSGLGRNLAVIGLDINKEGTTELVQYGLDGVNEHLANGGNMADVAEIFASRVASKEGLEQYLKGLVASGVLATPNIAVSTISNSKERQQALSLDTERRALIEQLNNEAVSSNPIAREAVLNKIESLTNDINTIVDKDFNDNKQDLPIEQVEQVSTLADMVTEIEQQIESENTPEEVKSALRDEQTRLQTAIDEIISTNNNTQNQEGISSEVGEGQESIQTEPNEGVSQEQVVGNRLSSIDGLKFVTTSTIAGGNQQVGGNIEKGGDLLKDVRAIPSLKMRGWSGEVVELNGGSMTSAPPKRVGYTIEKGKDGNEYLRVVGLTADASGREGGYTIDFQLDGSIDTSKLDSILDIDLTDIIENNNVTGRLKAVQGKLLEDITNRVKDSLPLKNINNTRQGEIVNETTQNDTELSMEGTNNTEQEITNNETETEILNDAVITDIESTQSPTELGQKESFARIVFNDSARTSRIQELESRLKVNNQNLGIAQDPMEQAKWMRDATEYAVLRIADGTIKTAKALGEVLGLSTDDVNLTKVFEDATKINNDLKKFEVPEVKQSVKATIRQSTEGRIQGKVTITNKQALTQRIRTLNEGARLGKQNIEAMRTEIKDMIKDLSDQKVFKGSINTTAVRQVANAVNRANTPKQVERALQVLDKVANDAKFAQKVASMDLYKDRINAISKSKSTPKDLSKVLREFGKVEIRDLDINDVDTYLNLAEGVYRRDRGVSQVSNVELQRVVDIANSNKEERQAEREAKRNTDEAKQAKVQNLRIRLSEVFGVEESTLNDIDKSSKPLDEVINDLQELVNSNKKTKEESVREVAKLYEAEIKANKAEILDNIPNKAERDLVEPILDGLNVDNVTKQSLPKYVTHLYNLLNNNSAVGLGDLAVEIIADKRVKDPELSKAVRESFVVPTKAMQWLGRNKFTSGSQLFDAVVKKREDIAEVHEFFGFTDVQINTNKALSQIESLNKDFNSLLEEYSKDLNFNPQGSLMLDIYSDVVQYRESWNAEQISNEFALRLEAWQKSLDRMRDKAYGKVNKEGIREGGNSHYAKENKDLIDNLEKVLDKYVYVSEVDGKQVVTPKVRSGDIWNDLTEGHKEFYNFARIKYDFLKEGLFAVSRVYGGLDVETDWVNYMPRMYSNIESTDALQTNRSLSTAGGRVDDIESLGNSFNSSVTKENTGSGKSRLISGNSLPINRIIRPNIINSFLGEASKIIYDSATMADRKLTSRMLDAERNGLQVEDEFPLEIYKSVVAQKILGDKYQLNMPEVNPSLAIKFFSRVGKLGTSLALGGATQLVKQTTPIIEVLGRVSNPTRVVEAISHLYSGSAKELIAMGDISVRAIEKELEMPKGSSAVSQQELSQLRIILRSMGVSADKVTETLTNFSLAPLKITDSYIAKVGWLSFYIDYESKNNNGVVDLTVPNKKAIAYANTQNSIVMNESDPSLGAKAMSNDYVKYITPFISFSVNSKITLLSSVTRLARAKDLKSVKRFSGELASNLANIYVFNKIGQGIREASIISGGYFLSTIISNVDLPEDEKEELLELVEKDKDNRIALNNLRSRGYLLQDFMFGGIFGKILEPATQSITDKVIASSYGEDELIARGYYGSKKALEKHWLESTFSMLGTQGIYGNKFMEVAKLAGDTFESSEDYVKRKYQQVGADNSSMIIDSYYLDPSNIDKFDQQEYEMATKATSLLFASVSLLGFSDQWLNSTNRYGNTILNSVLREKEGLVSKRESEEMLRQAKAVNDIEVGGIKVPLTYEKKLWYMKTYQDEYQSTVKEFPYKKDIPETEYNKIVKSIVEARMTDKFVRTNQDLFDKSISKLVRDLQKEAKELEDRYKYYGKK